MSLSFARALVLPLAVCFVLGIGGCGGGDAQSSASDDSGIASPEDGGVSLDGAIEAGPPVTAACTAKRCSGAACEAFTPTAEIFETKGLPVRSSPKTVTPLPPLITRTVALASGVNGKYKLPVVPAWRTTADGRVAFMGGSVATLRPESIGGPIVRAKADLAGRIFGARLKVDGMPVSKASTFLCQTKAQTPTACGSANGHDCYDVTAIVESFPASGGVQLTAVPIHIEVANPKTESAEVVDAHTIGSPDSWQQSDALPFTEMAEIMATADGHVFSGRTLGHDAEEGDETDDDLPQTYKLHDGKENTAVFSMFYAYASEPCNVRQWTARDAKGTWLSKRPIPAAPFDERLKDAKGQAVYGLAQRPLRDAFGKELAETDILVGAYPWMDREGNNLFFSTVKPTGARLVEAKTAVTRYPMALEGAPFAIMGSSPRGFSMVGSWTNGKTVMLDGLVNNEDYGVNSDKTYDYQLYRSKDGPLAVRANSGGKLNVDGDLPNIRFNGHFMESRENVWSMHGRIAPVTPRDVVWTLTRGLVSDEIAFDDTIDPHVVLFAEMTAAWKNQGTARTAGYVDGFNFKGNVFVHEPENIRLQNSATSPVYPIAQPGEIVGDARVEPVALGGVRGRGLWLEKSAAMKFVLPEALTAAIDSGPAATDGGFYAGVFVDARDDLAGTRHVMTITARKKAARVLLDDGGVLRVIVDGENEIGFDVSCLAGSWVGTFHHVGLSFAGDGTVIAFLDGNAAGTRKLSAPFRIGGGNLVVGGPSGDAPGIRGWYDEARLVVDDGAHPLTGPASVELLCNYARGTMVAAAAGSPFVARAEIASSYATKISGVSAPAGAKLVCATDYTADYAIGAKVLPKATTSVRDAILLEGTKPLRFDQPRPDSRDRSFCRSCHVTEAADPSRRPTLNVSALTAGTMDLDQDPRLQPSQPPAVGNGSALALGHIPANWITATDGKTYPAAATTGPKPILDWMFR